MTREKLGENGVLQFHQTLHRFARYVHSVRRNGPRGTLENAAALLEDAWFDRSHGTETARAIAIQDVRTLSPNKVYGVEYRPSRARAFRKLMDWLRLPPGRVLVDFGCGKGRILCMAAAYPFRRVVGVEFSPELCAVCRANIAACRARAHAAGGMATDMNVVEGDVLNYAFAGDENVLFFFNPFFPPVMRALMGRIHASLRSHPRDVLLILSNSEELASTMDEDRVFRRIGMYRYGSTHFDIYANRRG